jgi:hypothetical protein
MKQIILSLTAVVFSLFFTGAAMLPPVACYPATASLQTLSQKNGAQKDFKINRGKTLTVKLKAGGSVKITGWDKEIVSINVDSDEDAKIPPVEETDEGLTVSTGYDIAGIDDNVRKDLDIKVPDEFNLDIETNGGDVTLSGIKGEIKGQTLGGSLDLSNLKGEIQFTTMGGEINLKDSQLDGKLQTMGGEVFFENVVGDINGSSMGGDVTMKNVTSADNNSEGHKVVISTMGGSINIEKAMSGADINTMGGDIKIMKAAKYVTAKTMGGNIDFSEIDGGVKATTMGGNIDVKITGDNNGSKNIYLKSLYGNITLTVPEALSMDIDIRLAFTRDNEGKYDIKSDFNLNKEVSDKWSNDDGEPRKIIHGTGTNGNAKYKVILETINGNIYLKKS